MMNRCRQKFGDPQHAKLSQRQIRNQDSPYTMWLAVGENVMRGSIQRFGTHPLFNIDEHHRSDYLQFLPDWTNVGWCLLISCSLQKSFWPPRRGLIYKRVELTILIGLIGLCYQPRLKSLVTGPLWLRPYSGPRAPQDYIYSQIFLWRDVLPLRSVTNSDS